MHSIDTRALGLAVIGLGGGRTRGDERIDWRVGLTDLLPIGALAAAGLPIATVHAANAAAADAAAAAVQAAYRWCEPGHAPSSAALILGKVESTMPPPPPPPPQ